MAEPRLVWSAAPLPAAAERIRAALAEWGEDVRQGSFPGKAESFVLPEAAREALEQWRPGDGGKERTFALK